METPEICEQDNVKCLIKALLDVQEMVDIKYLNPPLGINDLCLFYKKNTHKLCIFEGIGLLWQWQWDFLVWVRSK